MKKILLALGLLGLINTSADAQSGKSSNSKFAQNYPVCLTSAGYKVCNSPTVNMPTTTVAIPPQGLNNLNMATSLPSSEGTTVIGRETSRSFAGYSRRKISRMVVSYDDPHAPYEGKESSVNDGVQKNIIRNINYLDQSVVLPANDGGLSNK